MALILAPPPTSKRETWNRCREKEEFENPIVGVIPSVVSVKKNRNYLWEGFHKNPCNTSIVTHHFTQANKAFPGSLEDGGTCGP